MLVTRAAKSKRVEMESVILAHVMAQQQGRISRSSAGNSPATRLSSAMRNASSR
jgi:hypothetical protein